MRRLLLYLGLAVGLLATPHGRCGTLAQFRTAFGTIDVELYDQDKPITVQNFIRYVTNGAYMDSIAHRVVTNFIIQGGGVFVSNRLTTPSLNTIGSFAPITNEFGVGKFYSNKYGTIAMAKTSDPNSATSQFFFNLTDNASSLDNTLNSGGFTVFGHVVGGTNVLNLFNLGPNNTSVKKVNLGGLLAELPVFYSANSASISYNDLIYLDVSLLNVQVTNVNNTARISWNSVSAKTNFVEYTTVFPPAWQTLTNFVGNGSATNVTDAAVGSGKRFYRVRVLY